MSLISGTDILVQQPQKVQLCCCLFMVHFISVQQLLFSLFRDASSSSQVPRYCLSDIPLTYIFTDKVMFSYMSLQSLLSLSLAEIRKWISQNLLQLNNSKSDMIMVTPSRPITESINNLWSSLCVFKMFNHFKVEDCNLGVFSLNV